jgi:catechol 2,3-dioxygenase-like lactoylglutathione lyase family enzyme
VKIQKLSLQSHDLASLKPFYCDVLGFPLLSSSAEAFSIQCGQSVLEFVQGPKAYYHFAYNVYPDQILSIEAWLAARGIPLLPFEDERIVQFPNWDAEAIYFYDPVGNILEFIARRCLPQRGNPTFSIDETIGICEIGFANYAMDTVPEQLQAVLGLPIFGASRPNFCALGDDHGLFILVDAADKLWIPNMEPALPFPFQATIGAKGKSWQVLWDNRTLLIS